MTYQDIGVDALDAFMAHDDELVVIDMRDEASRSRGGLHGAQPHSEAVMQGLVRRRRQDPRVLVYCYRGNQSRTLCGFLTQLGLGRVYNLDGGWAAWRDRQVRALTSEGPLNAWLLARGFDPFDMTRRDSAGLTALMAATLAGYRELAEALLIAGADTSAVNDDGHTALWFACVHGEVALVERLLASGSAIDHRNVNGVTCAIYAASTGKLDILETLTAAGADLSIRTPDGYDALDSSATLPVLRFLRARVTDPTQPRRGGVTH